MIDYAVHKAKLQARIASVKAARQPKLVQVSDECEHEYKSFKQTIRADNTRFSGSAYFIVRACVKCKAKQNTDMVVLA